MPVNKKLIQYSLQLLIEQLTQEAEALIAQVELETKKAILAGMPEKTVKKNIVKMVIANKGFAKAWSNKQDRIMREYTKRFVAVPVQNVADANPKQKFAWVLGEVKTDHCPDCLMLSGMAPRTIDEWRDLGYGLPQEGLTACNVGCRCMLSAVK